MKFKQLLSISVLCLGLLGCKSDETIDRDDVKIGAVYQEYNLKYSIARKEFKSNVYFKTSSSGDYIRLSPNDDVEINYRGIDNNLYKNMSRSKTQIYLGSRNVPTYLYEWDYRLVSGDAIAWRWYDSETANTYITKTTLHFPDISFVDEDNTVDTTLGEDLLITLSEALKPGQHLEIQFTGTGLSTGNTSQTVYFSKYFTGNKKQKTSYKILAKHLKQGLRGKPNDGDKPVILTGKVSVRASISVSLSNKVENGSPKGAWTSEVVSYPTFSIDVIL